MDIRPANKFLSNSPLKQRLHMTSELWEVWRAWVIYKLNPSHTTRWFLASEIIDLQSSGQTMLGGPLRLDKGYIVDCRDYVVYKNNIRGYYKMPE